MPTESSKSIIVACQCGKRFRAKSEHAGKRVKCPGCGSVLNISVVRREPAGNHDEPRPVVPSDTPKDLVSPEVLPFCRFCERAKVEAGPVGVEHLYRLGQSRGSASRLVKKALMGGVVSGLLRNRELEFERQAVLIGRCTQCAAAHNRAAALEDKIETTFVIAGVAIGGVVGLVSMFATASDKGWSFSLVLLPLTCFVLGLFIGFGLGKAVVAHVRSKGSKHGKPWSFARELPELKQMLADGWRAGEEPPPVSYTVYTEVPGPGDLLIMGPPPP